MTLHISQSTQHLTQQDKNQTADYEGAPTPHDNNRHSPVKTKSIRTIATKMSGKKYGAPTGKTQHSPTNALDTTP